MNSHRGKIVFLEIGNDVVNEPKNKLKIKFDVVISYLAATFRKFISSIRKEGNRRILGLEGNEVCS